MLEKYKDVEWIISNEVPKQKYMENVQRLSKTYNVIVEVSRVGNKNISEKVG